MDYSQKVHIDGIGPGFQRRTQKRVKGPQCSGSTDQHVDGAAKNYPGPVHSKSQLFRICDVSSNPEGVTAGLFDFDVRQIQFGLAATDQCYFCSKFRECQGEALTDSSPSTCNQNVLTSKLVCRNSQLLSSPQRKSGH